ncbi:TPA: FtsX-like permease family protein [Candidatus Bathyarchaeota archaeon]|nr:FtsX-like permease family protein [Candidatus Bathyarchaeota archaeon]
MSEASSGVIGAEIGTIKFPLSESFRFALESISKRFTRAVITALSVLLGIAFMSVLLTMGAILRNVGEAPPAYQYWMVVIALLVCGVGIVNSMLMAVTERYKEIGTMKCLGATDGSILSIFLIEALLLGVLGGVIGAIAGWVAAIVVYGMQLGFGAVFGFEGALAQYLYNVGISIGAATILSVIAAAYPAYYAAKLNPAEALRYEV